MIFANPFIKKHTPVLYTFLDAVSLSLPISSPEAPPPALNTTYIYLHDLLVVHDYFYRNRIALIRSLSNNTSSSLTSDILGQFCTHLNELGPSPIHLTAEFHQIPSIRKAQLADHRCHSPLSSSGDSGSFPIPSSPRQNEDLPQWKRAILSRNDVLLQWESDHRRLTFPLSHLEQNPTAFQILSRNQSEFQRQRTEETD